MIKMIIVASLLLAAPSKEKTAKEILEYMTLTYSQVEHMKSKFKKKSTSTLLGNTEKSSGELEYSKGKFKIEIKDKKRNLFIKGKKHFWHIEGDSVMKGDVSKAVPTVFDSIFSDPKIWSQMSSQILNTKGDDVEIKVDTNGKVPNIKSMNLTIDDKKKTLLKVSYMDDVNNLVEINFSQTRFYQKERPEKFKYKIKKSDELNSI